MPRKKFRDLWSWIEAEADERGLSRESIQEAIAERQRLEFLGRTSVMALFGERGSMKSAFMAYIALRRVMAGGHVLYWPPKYKFRFGEPLDLIELIELAGNEDGRLVGALVLLDEMQALQSKWRMSSRVNLEMRTMWQQLRKLRCDIVLTSNSPGEIDPTLQDFVDVHVFCKGVQDPRCERFGYHLSRRAGDFDDCQDAVECELYDTQSRYGKALTSDGRWRRKHLLGYVTRIADCYPLYNTFAVVSNTEIREVTSEVLDRPRVDQAEVLRQVAGNVLEHIVPQLVDQGVTEIRPSELEPYLIGRQLEIAAGRHPQLTKEYIGRVLRQLLPHRDTRYGAVYDLPGKEGFDEWSATTAASLASPGGTGSLLDLPLGAV